MALPIVVGISGASGVIYGVELLKALSRLGRASHLIVTEAGERNLLLESGYRLEDIRGLADTVHEIGNLAASVASGSYLTQGMIVAPCSIKTLSAIANSFNSNILVRAADVTLKERRPLVLMVRETPLHKGHLDLMARAADLGATILPPVPAYYHQPRSLQDIIDQTVGKALDQLGIEQDLFTRWSGSE